MKKNSYVKKFVKNYNTATPDSERFNLLNLKASAEKKNLLKALNIDFNKDIGNLEASAIISESIKLNTVLATEEQKKLLSSYGVRYTENLSESSATLLITRHLEKLAHEAHILKEPTKKRVINSYGPNLYGKDTRSATPKQLNLLEVLNARF